METTKKCFICGEEKPLGEFYAHPQMADGHLNKCKECTRAYVARHAAESPKAILETRMRMNAKNPTQYSAHKVVEAALAAGEIVKPDHCMGCGRPGSETRIGSHHHDYAKPLDVIWVCAKCHRGLDANRREREGKKPYGNARGVILVYDGHDVCSFDTISDAARSVGRRPSSISRCLSGKSKKSAGMEWRYA